MRGGISNATAITAWVNRNQRVRLRRTDQPVKVNLGCGMSVMPGWINVDGSLNALIAAAPRWLHRAVYRFTGSHEFYSQETYCEILEKNAFVHHNLAYGVPLTDRSADFVYCSHFLEHLPPDTGRRLLSECRRVLKTGGVLRVVVPDLAQAWEMYKRGDKAVMLHDYFFCGEDNVFARHRYAYDFEMLSELLQSVGFAQVFRRGFREGLTPNIDVLDNRPEYSLYVEAIR